MTDRIEPSSSEMCQATWYLIELLAFFFFLRIVHYFVVLLNAVKNCKMCKITIYFYNIYTFLEVLNIVDP